MKLFALEYSFMGGFGVRKSREPGIWEREGESVKRAVEAMMNFSQRWLRAWSGNFLFVGSGSGGNV